MYPLLLRNLLYINVLYTHLEDCSKLFSLIIIALRQKVLNLHPN